MSWTEVGLGWGRPIARGDISMDGGGKKIRPEWNVGCQRWVGGGGGAVATLPGLADDTQRRENLIISCCCCCCCCCCGCWLMAGFVDRGSLSERHVAGVKYERCHPKSRSRCHHRLRVAVRSPLRRAFEFVVFSSPSPRGESRHILFYRSSVAMVTRFFFYFRGVGEGEDGREVAYALPWRPQRWRRCRAMQTSSTFT